MQRGGLIWRWAKKQGTGEFREKPGQKKGKEVRAGSRTYFFDIEKTLKGKPYLRITERPYEGAGSQRERSTLNVFPEDAAEPGCAVAERSLMDETVRIGMIFCRGVLEYALMGAATSTSTSGHI